MGTAVLVATQKGAMIFRRAGSGSPWTHGDLQMKGWLVTAFARDLVGRTYAGVTHDVWGSAVMVSEDLDHWEQLEAAPRYRKGQLGSAAHNRILGATDPMNQYSAAGRHVDQIWKLLCVGGAVYAGVSEAGVFRSEDAGKSWAVLPGLDEHDGRESWVPGFGGLCAHSLLVDAQRPERIWVGISAAGVFRSDNAGESFEMKNDGVFAGGEGFCVHSLAHDPSAADVIYRQDHNGVYRSDDAGDSWITSEKGLPVNRVSAGHDCAFGFAIALDRETGSAYVVPIESDSVRYPPDGDLAVYRSRDRAETWERCGEGLPGACFANVLRGALTAGGGESGGVYFGTTSGSLYGSTDGGDSWQTLATNLPRILGVEAFEV